MSLEFIYGSASCEHERVLVEKAAEWLDADSKNEVFYLVPNHVKFETEVSVLKHLQQIQNEKSKSITAMNLQIFSFTRLAWYYLQHTALYDDRRLSEAGVNMVIRKILSEEAENLSIFRGEVDKTGFIQQLAELFSELQNGDVAKEDLLAIVQRLGKTLKEQDFKMKLADFQLLYGRYLDEVGEREIGTTQILAHLTEYLVDVNMSQVMIIVTGFSTFTAKELQLILTLMERAQEVKVHLVLTQAYDKMPPDKLSLFYETGSLYHELYQLARSRRVPVQFDTRLECKEESALVSLDSFWQESQKLSPKKAAISLNSKQIRIWEGETTYSEVSHIGKEIRRLVSTGDYRYRDIEILTREMTAYQEVIGPVFNSLDIPYYASQELQMKQHPLVELLISLFAINKRNFRYTDIMRFLRTELFLPLENNGISTEEWTEARDSYRNKVDVTENISLAYGYEGFYWTQEKDWVYVYPNYVPDSQTEDKNLREQRMSNEVRQDIRSFLIPFFKKLTKATSGAEAVRYLYEFLVASGVESQLLFWRNQDIEKGNLETAKIHEQTWQAFIHLLDEYVAILGEDAFGIEVFVSILTTGLEGLTYSKVPTTIDQVTLSSLDLIHAQKNKVTFIIGGTDQVLPKKIENTTLLTDDERQLFESNLDEGKFLTKQGLGVGSKEPFNAYLAFLSTTDLLYLSYPAMSDRHKGVKCSPYIERIAKGLNIPVEIKRVDPDFANFSLDFIGTYRSLISDLTNLKRGSQETKESLAITWIDLEKELLLSPQYGQLARLIFRSLNHKNIPEELTPQIIDSLYGKTIYGSVSKIETFHNCQYRYFMTYGLQLKERDLFGLSPAATGDFYHDSLDQLFKVLISEGLMLSELTPDELNRVTSKVLETVLDKAKFAVLNGSHRMNYVRYQLSQTIKRVSWALQRQSMRTGMSTVQTEVLFGQLAQETGLDSMKIKLSEDKEMSIRGKIDRVDRLETQGETFLSVVDYKSSRHTFDYSDAYFGLAMQMITYLDIALSNAVSLLGEEAGKRAKAGGAFYLQIKNPIVDGSIPTDEIEAQLLKEYGYKGLLINEEPLLEKLDLSVEETGQSVVYPYKQLKSGKYSSRQFVTEDELDLMIEHNRHNYKQAGQDIFAGKTTLNPAYQDKQRIACQYCPFRSVCQFDVMLKENNYNRLNKMDKNDVIECLKEKKGETTNE